MNSKALELLGVTSETPQPEVCQIGMEHGEPDGRFFDNAMDMVYDCIPAPDKDDVKAMLLAACRALNAYGVTSCQTDDYCAFRTVPWTMVNEAYQELEREGKLTVRVYEQSNFTSLDSLKAFVAVSYTHLVSGTDGVGTKLKLAFVMDKHNTVGIDCVAMCVNDIACAGGEPLFFLDYIACGKNYPEKIADIVSGVAEGCKQAGAAPVSYTHLCASGCEDYCILRERGGEICVIASGRASAVAAGHYYEFFDGAGFYGFYYLISQSHYLAVSKASYNLTCFNLNGRRAGFGMSNDPGEVFSAQGVCLNVSASGESYSACGVDSVFVAVLWRNEAVGSEKNWAVKGFELFSLFPPGISIIACEMGVFFKRRIIMGRQHFGVSVYINSSIFGLFQKQLQIPKIMARDKNGRVIPYADGNRCDLRLAVGFCVGLIQGSHDCNSVFACVQGETDQIIGSKSVISYFCQGCLQKFINLWTLLPQGVDAVSYTHLTAARRQESR